MPGYSVFFGSYSGVRQLSYRIPGVKFFHDYFLEVAAALANRYKAPKPISAVF